MTEDTSPLDCLNHLSLGVILCDAQSLAINFANGQAEKWFGEDLAGRPLPSVLTPVSPDDLASRLEAGRPYSTTGEAAQSNGRRFAYRLTVGSRRYGADGLLVVEVENISKQKEQEYLLESFSGLIERKNRELERERDRTERLLMNIFPLKVLQEFKEFGTTTPSFYDDVSVLFLDFVGFTRMPVSREPKRLISELNEIFSTFDQIVEHHACERIKTIGDAYLAVANMPSPNPDHAIDITTAAIKMLRYLERRNASHPVEWTCRIGIHTGSVVGSVVGVRKYIYDVFGDGVNTASRMQSLSEPMRITVSEPTFQRIKSAIPCTPRGMFEIRGADRMNIYFVDAAISASDPDTSGPGSSL
ncbi:adenylate/guanylate cyclase domain-containing protein [Pseudorhodoplanes sp.]|uniref:adenylate/guanylate cyclase domain-containing protein n=1 Tax=Pseudorhodoplanes sp. TaxID=1934341 RepID=UPI002BE25097|nr:adenylate/guanylate cyclase domain-containing protein [Pseudorhodoplanes sp.]HWV52184.1 adenylate/guanylate cyclase domain-containing protein [Pseudorhodoplanes sp.]